MRKTILLLASVIVALLLACGVGLLGVGEPAEAAFPGKNGKIAFVSNRDVGGGEIYTIGPNGGAATRITFTTGGHADPAYSPDGSKIAFTKGNQIFVMDANGMKPDGTGATQITFTATVKNQPIWSPDGTKIAYVANSFDIDRQTDLEIWAVNADGTGTPSQLTDNTFPDTQPAWSPLGNEIAFVSARTGDTNRNVYLMDADPATDDAAVNLTPNTTDPVYQGNDEDPAWSPDGTKIAYSNGNSDVDVWKINRDRTGKTKLAGDPSREETDPAFSPDGTKIAFVATTSSTNRDIWKMDADGTDQAILHANAAHDVNPDWQQDSIPPNTTITSGPSGTTNDTSPRFSFASSETSSTFRCSLDGAPFSACVSPKSYSDLPNGSHTFRVRATDVAGNVDPTPANRNFTVDTVAPTVESVSPTGTRVAPKANATATFSEAMRPATLNTKTFKLVKKGTTASVPAKITYSAATMKATLNPDRKLKAGATYKATITTRAKDAAGNLLAASKVWAFKVKK